MKPSEALTNNQYNQSINLAVAALEHIANAQESKDLIKEIEISRVKDGEDTYKLILTSNGIKKGKYWTFTMHGYFREDDTTTSEKEEEMLTRDKFAEVVTFFDIEASHIEALHEKLH
jgi:hypothetical protein